MFKMEKTPKGAKAGKGDKQTPKGAVTQSDGVKTPKSAKTPGGEGAKTPKGAKTPGGEGGAQDKGKKTPKQQQGTPAQNGVSDARQSFRFYFTKHFNFLFKHFHSMFSLYFV